MTIIEIIDAFTFYGLDVLLLALATALTVQLCKVTFLKKSNKKPGVMAHTFNPSTHEAEAGRFLSSRQAWSTN